MGGQQVDHLAEPLGWLSGAGFGRKLIHKLRTGSGGLFSYGRIEKPLRVVAGRPENLAAGDVPKRGGDAALDEHIAGGNHVGIVTAAQGSAISPQQKRRLEDVPFHLFQRQSGVLRGIKGAFAHYFVHQQAHLGADLLYFDRRGLTSQAVEFHQLGGVGDGVFSTFYGYVSHCVIPS